MKAAVDDGVALRAAGTDAEDHSQEADNSCRESTASSRTDFAWHVHGAILYIQRCGVGDRYHPSGIGHEIGQCGRVHLSGSAHGDSLCIGVG
jgi:hypothetical protein